MGMVDGKAGCDHSAEPWRNFDDPSHEASWGAALDATGMLWRKWIDSEPVLESGELQTPLGVDDMDVETLDALVEKLMQHTTND